jgi:hypothetical protein
MEFLFIVWIFFAVIFFLLIGNGEKGGALTMSYFFGLSLIHVPGLYVNTSSKNGLPYNIETENGFIFTLYGMFFFLIGILIAKIVSAKKKSNLQHKHDYLKQSRYLIIFGLAVFIIFLPIVTFIPSLTSIVSPLNGLLMIGFWYLFFYAKISNKNKYIYIGLFTLPILPILTMITGGFMGFGVYWVLTIVSFLYVLNKKTVLLIFMPFIGVLGVSFAVAYFNERDNLRENVWIKQNSYTSRFDNIYSMVESFKIIDKNDYNQAKLIDDRLNQNILLGQAIREREAGRTVPAYGSTVPIWVFIPRIIWPEKPTVGGSNSLVSDYTGRTFASGTSVGVGQPLEFYINFGLVGIIIGYFIFGFLLMKLDLNLMYSLKEGNILGVLRNGLIGISLLQPGGSLLEILTAVIGSLILTPFIARQIHLSGLIKSVLTKQIKVKNKFLIQKK